MGYLTAYALSIRPPGEELREVPKNLTVKDILTGVWGEAPWVDIYRAILAIVDGEAEWNPLLSEDRSKWYGHESDMRGLSRACPSVLFILHGAGEEQGDAWNKYFVDGRMQVAKVSTAIDAFDPARLDTPKEG
ncbi:MAG TPA: hypothetical protein VM537_24600 [Anaerolineae bacterium]|nr:hypothetical protein [Anaerolineae bacterium]